MHEIRIFMILCPVSHIIHLTASYLYKNKRYVIVEFLEITLREMGMFESMDMTEFEDLVKCFGVYLREYSVNINIIFLAHVRLHVNDIN